MSKIFKNKMFDNLFKKDGYLILDHNIEIISVKLKELFDNFSFEHNESGFSTTHFSKNENYKKELLVLSEEIFNNYFSTYFINYEVLFSNFMIKYPNKEALLPVHADWTYVDENENTAISLWIPLVDINKQNSPLGIIPKSHQLFDIHRGPDIISSYRKYDHILMKKHSISLPISHLQAIAYNIKLLHYSLPNISKDIRIALNITLVPKNANIIHCINVGNKINLYENLDKNFFLKYHAHQIPSDILPTSVLNEAECLKDDEILSYYKIDPKEQKSSFLQKLFGFIN